MKTFTFSIVIPTRKNPATLYLALTAVLKTATSETEVVIVPDTIDGEPDAATVGLAEGMIGRNGSGPALYVLPRATGDAPAGFAGAANLGLRQARGKYLIVLHDDTLVTKGWLDGLRATLLAAQSAIPDTRWGYVGPMTNFAMPQQSLAQTLPQANEPGQAEAVAALLRTQAQEEFFPAGPLDSFCLLMTRQAYEKVGGFDERFGHGGHEDVDLILRAQRAGYFALRAPRVFIYHKGRSTLAQTGLGPHGDIPNQLQLMEKWYPEPGERPEQTLCFLLRVQLMTERQRDAFVAQVLELRRLGTSLVLIDDRSTFSALDALKANGLRDFVVAHRVNPEHLAPNAKRDRNLLIQMGRETGTDWLMGIEQGHRFDDKVTRASLQSLMQPVDPTTMAYQYPIRTYWKGLDFFRVDEDWGRRYGCSFFRNYDWGGMLKLLDTPQDTLPTCLPHEQIQMTSRIVLDDHNYLDLAEARAAGFAFFENPTLVIRAKSPTLGYVCIVKNEASELARIACQFAQWSDEFLLVDNGSTDMDVQSFCARFELPYVEYPCCSTYRDPQHMICDFAAGRNFAIDRMTTDYLFAGDADEELDARSYPAIATLIMEGADAFLCDINNHQVNPKTGILQTYITIQARLFKKHPLIRYESPVHETLEHALKRHAKSLAIVKSDIVIEHHGYTREKPDERAWKGEQYAKKLVACIEQDPTDARSVYALGQHLNSQKNFDQGDPLLGRALAIDPDFFTCRLDLSLRMLKRGYDLLMTTPPKSVPNDDRRQAVQAILAALHPYCRHL